MQNFMLPPALQNQLARDPRMAFALQAQQAGMSNRPTTTAIGGLARALQAPIGALMQRGVMQDYQGQADSYQKAMADALGAYGRGDIEAAAAAASQNPLLGEFGANLAIKGVDQQNRIKMAEQEALARALTEEARAEREIRQFEQRETAAERRHRERLEAAAQREALSGGGGFESQWRWNEHQRLKKIDPELAREFLGVLRQDPRDALIARAELGGEAKAAEEAGAVRGRTQAEREAAQPKVLNKVRSAQEKYINLQDTIKRAKEGTKGFFASGFGSGVGSFFGGSSGVDLENDLKTIKANLGFQELAQMRDNSPTGGALGQVAVQELAMLQSTVESLEREQSDEQLRRNLDKVDRHLRRWAEAVRMAYEEQYGELPEEDDAPPPPPGYVTE